MKKLAWIIVSLVGAVVFLTSLSFVSDPIPKTWDLAAIKKFHLPPPDTTVKVIYAPEEYYESLPEYVIYKTYPVYIREFERPGYMDSLRQLTPEVAFDLSKIKNQQDWIDAGKLVFEWPAAFTKDERKVSRLDLNYVKETNDKMTSDGVYPFRRYVITEKGKLKWGSLSCASCHTRVLENGELIAGAQGNSAADRGFGYVVKQAKIPFEFIQDAEKRLNTTPWVPLNTIRLAPADIEEALRKYNATPDGVMTRQGNGSFYPIVIPSLIGVKDIKYLDRTGLMRHEGPGDMMRYAAFNQGMDMLTSYNGFVPAGTHGQPQLPPPTEWHHPFGYAAARYSDAQLYALTQYIYSLKPPKNPNTAPKDQIKKGSVIFAKAGCVTCHTPPLYTNNKLTPASGFEPPANHFTKYDIFNVSVETDSVSTLYTRRGTGYYKIPSLLGVWYRNAFFHNGNLATLEEVLDPKRLEPEFAPTGYKPPYSKTMAVKGHPFGLDLSAADKKALIAFLKSL